MTDKSDVMAVVGRSEYDLPEVRGRAMIKVGEVHVAQCYLAVEGEDDISYATGIAQVVDEVSKNNTGKEATGVRILPEVVTYQDLEPYVQVENKQGVIGFDIESTEPMVLDLSIPIQTIIGAPATGKTNLLKILLTQFKGKSCFIADSRAGDLVGFEGQPGVTYMGAESQLESFYTKLEEEVTSREKGFEKAKSPPRLKDYCATLPPVLVFIDDGDNFIELCKAKAMEMEKLLPKAKDMGISFVLTALPSQLRGFDGITKVLKDNQSGVVLGLPGEQTLVSIQTPRGYKATPDIGFWYKRGNVKQVKMPLI